MSISPSTSPNRSNLLNGARRFTLPRGLSRHKLDPETAAVVEDVVRTHFANLEHAQGRFREAHDLFPEVAFLPRLYNAANPDQFKAALTTVYDKGQQSLLFKVLKDPEEVIRSKMSEPIRRKRLDYTQANPEQIARNLRFLIERDQDKSFIKVNGNSIYRPDLSPGDWESLRQLSSWLIGEITPHLPKSARTSSLSIEEQGALLARDISIGEYEDELAGELRGKLKGRGSPKKLRKFIIRELPAYQHFHPEEGLNTKHRHHNSLENDLAENISKLKPILECEEGIPCFHVLRAFYGWMGAEYALRDSFPYIGEIASFKQLPGSPTRYAFRMRKHEFWVKHSKEYVLVTQEGEVLAEVLLKWKVRGIYDCASPFKGTLRCEDFRFTTDDADLRRKICRLLFTRAC